MVEIEETAAQQQNSLLPLPSSLRDKKIAESLWLFEDVINKERRKVCHGARLLARCYRKVPFDVDRVEQALAGDLAATLLDMISRAVVLELNVARLENTLKVETPAQRFDSVLRGLREHDVAGRFLDEYPVLLEQVKIKLQVWADYGLEFMKNLCGDWEDIRKTFFARDPALLEAAQFGAGESHRRGRSVIVLRFATGARLVYKPRSLAIDEHFNMLLEWLNRRGVDPPFLPARSLNRGRYGWWTEFIRDDACVTELGVRRFYERQGTYLAILYAFEATDFHYQNLIAAGEYPMFVDLETLFHPRFPEDREDTPLYSLRHSVVNVGLLPERFAGLEMSGLGGAAGQSVPKGAPCWENAETDEMRLIRKSAKTSGARNRPRYDDAEVDASQYTAEIARGFERTYRLMIRYRDDLVSMVRSFADDEVRVVVRPTHLYASLLWASFHPDVLRDSQDRNALFEGLAGADVLCAAEKGDLMRGDVPFFSTKPSSRDLWTSDGNRIENYFNESDMNLVLRRIEGLSERDLQRQLSIVRASLATLSSATVGRSVGRSACSKAERNVGRSELLAEAMEDWRPFGRVIFGQRRAHVDWLGAERRGSLATGNA